MTRLLRVAGVTRQGWRVSAVIVVVLALCIGVNAALFTATSAFLIAPPAGIRDVDALRRLYIRQSAPGGGEQIASTFSYPQVAATRDLLASAQGRVAAWLAFALPVGRSLDARRLTNVGFTNASYFATLGVRPLLGRLWDAAENDLGGHERGAVLGERYWREQLGADSAIVGTTVWVGGRQSPVIGVASAGFEGAGNESIAVWLLLGATPPERLGPFWHQTPLTTPLAMVVRSGIPDRSLAARLSATLGTPELSRPDVERSDLIVAPLLEGRGPAARDKRMLVSVLYGLSVLVLLAGVGNAAHLMLLRTVERQRIHAIRLALGGTMRYLRLDLLIEVTLLAVVASLLAVAVASALRGTLGAALVIVPVSDWRNVLYRVAVAVVVSAVCLGLAATGLRVEPLAAHLRENFDSGSGDVRRLRYALVLSQLVFSFIVLTATATILRSTLARLGHDAGFDSRHTALVSVQDGADGSARETMDLLVNTLVGATRSMPGVRAAAVAYNAPLASVRSYARLLQAGRLYAEREPVSVQYNAVGADYHATLGLRLVRGASFSRVGAQEPVAMVNVAFARRYLEGDPIGQCVRITEVKVPCLRVVGVFQNAAQFRLGEPPEPELHVPLALAEGFVPSQTMVVQFEDRVVDGGERLRQRLSALVPSGFWIEVRPYTSILERQSRRSRTTAHLIVAFAGVGALLSLAGAFAVFAAWVRARRREFAVRAALGASPASLTMALVRQAVLLAITSVVVGAFMLIPFASWARSRAWGVPALEIRWLLAGAAATLVIVLLGALVPARAILRTSPSLVLRS